ncbi:hypothetical protein CCR75_007379 [Bremia lactucae]|uniref:Uncharacterized protein n=1 Tax=Bremia lactucae TaxID=4779 RepID=A0A976FGW4_BRELC|nr:hypothetical protein CCR75_007379 [Bremia lactucae]
MLTRSRSKASKQPVFIDDNWNDAYIQAKDEQIDALLATSQRGWNDLEEENSEAFDSDSDEDAWHSDSDESEDNDEDWLERPHRLPKYTFSQRWVAGGGLLQNVCWTLAGVAVAPVLLYASLPRYEKPLWPLQSPHFVGFLSKVSLNVLSLTVAAAALYGALCGVEPLAMTNVLQWRHIELEPLTQCRENLLRGVRDFFQNAVDFVSGWPTAPLRQSDDGIRTVVDSLNAPMVYELALLAAGVLVMLTCFYRAWAKILVLLIIATYVAFNVNMEIKMQQRAAIEIYSLDPDFAFVNESIFVAIDGHNLEVGGSVAWMPYWDGLHQQEAHVCPKRFPQQLKEGGVFVTFSQVDEYVPCYLSAKETASAVLIDGEIQPSNSFQCYENVRLRVKDHRSVPGWSLHLPQQKEEET